MTDGSGMRARYTNPTNQKGPIRVLLPFIIWERYVISDLVFYGLGRGLSRPPHYGGELHTQRQYFPGSTNVSSKTTEKSVALYSKSHRW